MTFGYQIYFTERSHNRVVCWNPDSGTVKVVAGQNVTGTGRDQLLSDPYGLSIDSAGHLLVADKRNNRVARLTSRLDTVVSRDPDGHRGDRLIPSKNYPFCPTGIFTSTAGSLLVAYCDDGSIYRLQADGSLSLLIGVPRRLPAAIGAYRSIIPLQQVNQVALFQPTSIVEGPDRTIYYIERGFQAVRSYGPNRGISSIFRSGKSRGAGAGGQGLPKTMRLSDYSPDYPSSLTIGPDHELYLADANQRCVWQVDLAAATMFQVYATTPLPGRPSGGPSAIAFGPDGTLWILDYGEGRIVGIARTMGGWRRVGASCSTVYESAPCVASEGAGIVCSAN
jgi:sugar lactone lactonase YvrE